MTAPLDLEGLKRIAEAATPGGWDVWAEPVTDRYAAIFELSEQVHATDDFVGKLFLLNASGKCPATTGCGATSEANAAYIATFDPPTVLALLAALEAAKEREGAWIDHILNDDHKRGCQGREYACTCGYDAETDRLAGYIPPSSDSAERDNG